MQGELLMENPSTKIRLLGINAAGLEGSNPTIIAGRTIPWLQDTAGANVYGSWGGQQQHLQILDTFNIRQAVFSHVLKPLGAPPNANYSELKALLKTIAGE